MLALDSITLIAAALQVTGQLNRNIGGAYPAFDNAVDQLPQLVNPIWTVGFGKAPKAVFWWVDSRSSALGGFPIRAVVSGLNELRKLVNRIMQTLGEPADIVVENRPRPEARPQR